MALTILHAQDIRRLQALCERHRDDPHKKLRALAGEFLNDWEVILRPVAEPNLPLTNNPAEVVRLLVQLTKPAAGNTVYDPTAGSGGFLIQAHQCVE